MTSRPGAALEAFAEEVGAEGPVAAAGGRTQWSLGGELDPAARVVRAPAGICEYNPAEMTVRVLAGTPTDELAAALGERGQYANLPVRPGGTVGGALAAGRSTLGRLGRGPIRETLLQLRWVSAEGVLVKAGGPVVKNVTGFDLCRLAVGSLGTLGLFGEVILRTRPLPAVSRWFAGEVEPWGLRSRFYWPGAILWNGSRTWLLLEGHAGDVADDAAVAARLGLAETDSPPDLGPHRLSLRPSALPGFAAPEGFVAEVGVGVVHLRAPAPPPAVDPVVAELNQRVKAAFDPIGRLNPGRRVLP
ncbi:MAG: FAD-binding oxidoreductase [Acidimicrobiales bacterium]